MLPCNGLQLKTPLQNLHQTTLSVKSTAKRHLWEWISSKYVPHFAKSLGHAMASVTNKPLQTLGSSQVYHEFLPAIVAFATC